MSVRVSDTVWSWYAQLLEITIVDIVARPLRNGVELDAVRELHCFTLQKPEILPPASITLDGPVVDMSARRMGYRKAPKLNGLVQVAISPSAPDRPQVRQIESGI